MEPLMKTTLDAVEGLELGTVAAEGTLNPIEMVLRKQLKNRALFRRMMREALGEVPEGQRKMLAHILDLMDHAGNGEEEAITALHATTELFTSAALTETQGHKSLPIVRKHIADGRRAHYEAAFKRSPGSAFRDLRGARWRLPYGLPEFEGFRSAKAQSEVRSLRKAALSSRQGPNCSGNRGCKRVLSSAGFAGATS
jgi:hypothetical protein